MIDYTEKDCSNTQELTAIKKIEKLTFNHIFRPASNSYTCKLLILQSSESFSIIFYGG